MRNVTSVLLAVGIFSTAHAAPAKLESTAHQVLDALLRVDTSKGDETTALKPIAERFERAGIKTQLLESAPGRGNLIARLKGTGEKRPLLLLAHIDVVPVDGQPWTSKPFEPLEKDGYLQARGVGDDKSMAAAIVAVALELKETKTPLKRDVIIALTAGEETGGAPGVRWLVAHHKELLDAELALNEGGPLLLSADEKKVKMVGIGSAEKTYQSFTLTVRGKGGHSSVPSPESDPVPRLARALVKVGELRFPARVIPAVKEALAARAGWETGALKAAIEHAVASAPKLAAADEAVLAAEPSLNAVIRTTCVTTMLEAAPADNVLPTTAKATVNCRIMPDQTRQQTQAALEHTIGDPAVDVKPLEDVGVSPSSPVAGPVPDAIRAVAQRMWPGVAVANTLGTGASDSRHLRPLGIAAYGMATAPMSLEEGLKGHGAHGPDERRPLRWMDEGTRFLAAVVRELVK